MKMFRKRDKKYSSDDCRISKVQKRMLFKTHSAFDIVNILPLYEAVYEKALQSRF